MDSEARPEGLLTTAELAARPDFALGRAIVSPSTRTVRGPGGQAEVEPRVMQVLVVLAEAKGAVVTRETLFRRCWGSPTVGDDSLNRAVGRLRRVAAGVAEGSFEVETIARVGYRVTGDVPEQPGTSDDAAAGQAAGRGGLSRRRLIGAGAAAAALGAGGLWIASGDRGEARFDMLMRRGREAVRYDDAGAAAYFREAAALQPGSAPAWGLLAYALGSGADGGPATVTGGTAQQVERAARTALRIDPREPNALLAMTLVQSQMFDWISLERRYLQILAIDAGNTPAMRGYGQLLHSVGRCRESLAVTERALALEPLWPDQQIRKALRLWVLGRVAGADRVSERALELWPSHRLVRLARLMIFAFTGRARAAMAMVEEEASNPRLLTPAAASTWRVWLNALESPTAPNVALARDVALRGSQATPAIAAVAILVLSALGELDAAFEVAEGFLLGRGALILRPRQEARPQYVNTPGWRNTFGLFTPPTRAMRLDSRFRPLADGLGLTEYWRDRRIGPDDFLFRA